jgi:hypothetical protein
MFGQWTRTPLCIQKKNATVFSVKHHWTKYVTVALIYHTKYSMNCSQKLSMILKCSQKMKQAGCRWELWKNLIKDNFLEKN